MFYRCLIILCLLMPNLTLAASLKEYKLSKSLKTIATKSNEGIPRQINEDLTDKGYKVKGNTLINHIEVSQSQASQMRENPKAMYFQLGASVCRNANYAKLLKQGAVLSYYFTEANTNKKIAEKRYTASDCGL